MSEALGLSRENRKYDPPDRDEIHDLLSNHRRRYVIYLCKRTDGSVSLSDLAEQIAAWEQDKKRGQLTSAERKRVYTSLQQTHLPRLADAEMIEYDGDEVTLSEKAAELDIYLDIVPSGSIPWGVYYLALSFLSAVVLFGVWVGFVPTDTVPPIGWAIVVLFVFLASSLVQIVQNRRYRLDRMERPP